MVEITLEELSKRQDSIKFILEISQWSFDVAYKLARLKRELDPIFESLNEVRSQLYQKYTVALPDNRFEFKTDQAKQDFIRDSTDLMSASEHFEPLDITITEAVEKAENLKLSPRILSDILILFTEDADKCI